MNPNKMTVHVEAGRAASTPRLLYKAFRRWPLKPSFTALSRTDLRQLQSFSTSAWPSASACSLIVSRSVALSVSAGQSSASGGKKKRRVEEAPKERCRCNRWRRSRWIPASAGMTVSGIPTGAGMTSDELSLRAGAMQDERPDCNGRSRGYDCVSRSAKVESR